MDNLPSRDNLTNLPTSSLTSQDKIATAIQKFGEEYREMVFCKYQKPTGIEKAVSANAPTFHDITDFFGEKATLFWLRFHIAEAFAFCGIYDTASAYQIRTTAEMIIQHEIYGQLTLSEFLCFLQRFKQGRYGKIYNSNRPNPQEFLMCLQPYWNELSYERGKAEERKRQEEISKVVHSSENMTYEEYLKTKDEQSQNPLDICYQRFTQQDEQSL